MNNLCKLLCVPMIAISSFGTLGAESPVPAANHGINKADLDLSVKPGDDFFEYAGGGWMKANPIGDQYARYGTFEVLAEKNREQLRTLFNDLASQQHENGSVAQKVTDLYKLAMDSVRLNNEGAAPLRAELDQLKAFNRKDLTKIIANQHIEIANTFFSFGISADMKNSDMNVAYIGGAGLGLPDRDYYLKTDADTKKIQDAYIAYLEKMFALAGYKGKECKRIAKNIYKIEAEFAAAQMSRTEARDRKKLYNPFTLDQLIADYPNIDWKQYLEIIGLPQVDRVIVQQPKVLAKANELLGKLKDQEIKDYMAGKILSAVRSYLSDDFGDVAFDFYGKMLSGSKERQPRWKRALGLPNGMLGEAVGELYVNKYFARGSKEKMMKLVNDLRISLAEHISKLTWMSDSTKINALVKLNSFTVKIGYPDKWEDYSNITIDPSKTLWENVKAAGIYNTHEQLSKYGKPVDKSKWGMTPQTINAYYSPVRNEICFPAGILQAPFFDVDADDACNYGAIGVVIGHEMTHGFDDQGRNFDEHGNMKNWWSAEDSKNFLSLTDVLVKQFNEIIVSGDTHANGKLTLGENIADQGGLRVAYTAFKKTQQGKSGEAIDGFTPDQRFYLAYARVWAANIREEAILQRTKTDVHSLGKWRVNATLRNIQPFYDAFNVKPGDAMYLAPEDRVVIW